MAKYGYKLEPLDRVVNLYQRLREDGETVDVSWQWACLIAREVERHAFREAIEADLLSLEVADVG
jgi:hypothetical protein